MHSKGKKTPRRAHFDWSKEEGGFHHPSLHFHVLKGGVKGGYRAHECIGKEGR